MSWNLVNTVPVVAGEWQLTPPVVGRFFRLKHTLQGLAIDYYRGKIAQAQLLEDGTIELYDTRALEGKTEAEIFEFVAPGAWSERRLAFKGPRGDIPPVTWSWEVQIEVSDFLEEEGGQGLTPKGEWDAAVAYQPGEIVTYQGSAWVTFSQNTNAVPGAGEPWELFVAKGNPGDTGPTGAVGPQGNTGPQGPTGPSGLSPTRDQVIVSLPEMVDGATAQAAISLGKTFQLLQVATSVPAWVRFYSSSAKRSADAARTFSQDPAPGSGVIADTNLGSKRQLSNEGSKSSKPTF